MLLETLKEFDWMNEPQRVRFDEDGMLPQNIGRIFGIAPNMIFVKKTGIFSSAR